MTYLALSVLQHVQFWMDSFCIWHKWSLAWDGAMHAMTMTLQWNCYNMTHLAMSASQHIQVWMNSVNIWYRWSLTWQGLWCTMTLTLTYIFKVIYLWCLFISLYSYVSPIQPIREWCVMYHFQVNRSNIKVTRVTRIFAVGVGGILEYYWSKIYSFIEYRNSLGFYGL